MLDGKRILGELQIGFAQAEAILGVLRLFFGRAAKIPQRHLIIEPDGQGTHDIRGQRVAGRSRQNTKTEFLSLGKSLGLLKTICLFQQQIVGLRPRGTNLRRLRFRQFTFRGRIARELRPEMLGPGWRQSIVHRFWLAKNTRPIQKIQANRGSSSKFYPLDTLSLDLAALQRPG